MAGETRVTLEGGLTRDPELAFAASGKAHARFSIAVGSRQKNQDGTWGDGPSAFWNCVVFGPLAEHVTESLHKGDRVIAVGELRPEVYTKDGEEKRTVKVIVENIGPSLMFATAAVNKASRSGGQQNAPQSQPQSQPQGGGWGNDPWATGAGDVPF